MFYFQASLCFIVFAPFTSRVSAKPERNLSSRRSRASIMSSLVKLATDLCSYLASTINRAAVVGSKVIFIRGWFVGIENSVRFQLTSLFCWFFTQYLTLPLQTVK